MDSLINAAARALACGDPLGALKRIALRDDPPALALRGIAMAQLGDFSRARALMRRAARAFGPKEAVARARCVIAEVEIALAARDLTWPTRSLNAAIATLEAHGDRINAAHARYLDLRRLVLIGRLQQAEDTLAALDPASLPAALRAFHELIVAGIALRHVHTATARTALARAHASASQAAIPALMAEVEQAMASLEQPAARLSKRNEERTLKLAEVETVMRSNALIVDACRHAVRANGSLVSLAKRPVLFSLVRALAQAWPDDMPREELIQGAFRVRTSDESFRARLRVEIGRLRSALRSFAEVRATARGFVLDPLDRTEVVVLRPPFDDEHADVLALLSDGESWSSSALALALAASQRSVQRALDSLAAEGKVQSIGRGRARRWLTPPLPGFATTLLLPAPLPNE